MAHGAGLHSPHSWVLPENFAELLRQSRIMVLVSLSTNRTPTVGGDAHIASRYTIRLQPTLGEFVPRFAVFRIRIGWYKAKGALRADVGIGPYGYGS